MSVYAYDIYDIAEEELKRALRIYIRAFGNLAEVEDLHK